MQDRPAQEQPESSPQTIDEILRPELQLLLLPLHWGLLRHQEEGGGIVDIPGDGFLFQLNRQIDLVKLKNKTLTLLNLYSL